MPTRFGVQFKLVRFYYAQRRAGRPRSSPSPLRGNCRLRRWERFGISIRFMPQIHQVETQSIASLQMQK
ncbi:MAG: hypothetical protein LBQ66_09355 [Planctomycetaceae bacterium]|nr:hypothetical protein [Planctomycetaceae bacterium]